MVKEMVFCTVKGKLKGSTIYTDKENVYYHVRSYFAGTIRGYFLLQRVGSFYEIVRILDEDKLNTK